MDYSKAVGLNPKYNTFDLSHDKRLTLQMGEIVPVMALDVLPGDKFTIESSHLTRFMPLVAPVMHNVKVKVRYFFSPNRLVWENWEDFITGPESATDTVEPVHPTIIKSAEAGSLMDYMGVSTNTNDATRQVQVNALPFAHYQFIYNEYFRDQNLIDEVPYELNDGLNSGSLLTSLASKRKVAWKHDRFTSALPFTQKGPEVTLPIVNADISLTSIYNAGTSNLAGNGPLESGQVGPITQGQLLANGQPAEFKVKATDLNAATINELREAFAIQKWLELNARSGNRYTEHIQAHFGVTPQDARLQRPEEFGGSTATIQFSEVLQTSETDQNGTALGTMGGHGITASGSRKSSYYAQEHGWIFALAYVVPETGYYQGVPKKFDKIDRYDYYQPLLAHLGEQPVKMKELYAQGNSNDENTFGYLPIYDEYRHEQNSVHGLMKNQLEHWHLGRKFANAPSLNETFISCDPDDRIFVDITGEEEQVIMHVHNGVKVGRKVPYYGTPLGV
ncbi:MAG: major capsid protein [Bacteroidia bacterium]